MNFCIEINTLNNFEIVLDGVEIKKYLDEKYKFSELNDKQIKKKIIEIINTEELILQILDDLDITYKYFLQIIYVNYATIFTTSFINKHVKSTFQKYKDF